MVRLLLFLKNGVTYVRSERSRCRSVRDSGILVQGLARRYGVRLRGRVRRREGPRDRERDREGPPEGGERERDSE